MATIGEELKRERARRGLTLKDVEQVLHIRMAYLEALETDSYQIIPGSVYVKGFIRNYANFLGLEGQRLIDTYKSQAGEETVIKLRPVQLAKAYEEDRKRKPLKKESAPLPNKRLSYEGRRRYRQKTLQQERLTVGFISVLAVLFMIWLLWF